MVFAFVTSSVAVAHSKYKIGDRVECDAAQMGAFKKGTIVPFPKNEDQTVRAFMLSGINEQ